MTRKHNMCRVIDNEGTVTSFACSRCGEPAFEPNEANQKSNQLCDSTFYTYYDLVEKNNKLKGDITYLNSIINNPFSLGWLLFYITIICVVCIEVFNV